MTTYTTITNALVAVGAKPFATTIQALRDNPIAIGEADSTVPAGLLPTVLLGTLATTSGSTQTLSGLVLTPYKALMVVVNAVSTTSASSSLVLNVNTFAVLTSGSSANTGSGGGFIDLASGAFWSSSASSGGTTQAGGGVSGLSNASTSITFTLTGGGTFDAGSIRIYGVK